MLTCPSSSNFANSLKRAGASDLLFPLLISCPGRWALIHCGILTVWNNEVIITHYDRCRERSDNVSSFIRCIFLNFIDVTKAFSYAKYRLVCPSVISYSHIHHLYFILPFVLLFIHLFKCTLAHIHTYTNKQHINAHSHIYTMYTCVNA